MNYKRKERDKGGFIVVGGMLGQPYIYIQIEWVEAIKGPRRTDLVRFIAIC